MRQAFATPLRKSGDLAAQVQRRAAAAEALGKIESGGYGVQSAFWTLPYGEPVWVEIPAGEFWMGSEKGEGDEKPVHKVHLERYWIAKTPITNAQYRLFVETTGHRAPGYWENSKVLRGLESHLVVRVTWHDAMTYCKWLSEVTGQAITLPTEAQWEKAARGAQDQAVHSENAPQTPGGLWASAHSWYPRRTRATGVRPQGYTLPAPNPDAGVAVAHHSSCALNMNCLGWIAPVFSGKLGNL